MDFKNGTPLNCPTNVIIKKGKCNSNGYQIIREFRNVVRKCKCVVEKFRQYRCQCRCCKDKIEYTCDRALRIETKSVTKYSILLCKCLAKITLSSRPIKCQSDSRIEPPCTPVRSADHSVITNTETKHHVDHGCKCVSKTTVNEKSCR